MLKRVLCPELPTANRSSQLPEAEAHHAVKVLRLRDGDRVEAMDGKGHAVEAILRIKHGPVRLEWAGNAAQAQDARSAGQSLPPVTLEMAILKGDAMEWVIEKSVELGVPSLTPVVTAHTVVQIKAKGPEAFRDRWQKIADQALKQCGRLQRLEVALPTDLETLLARSPASDSEPRLWCDEAARSPGSAQGPAAIELMELLRTSPPKAARLLIGPEGGWSEAERTLLRASGHVVAVSLGPLVLRAETAAIAGTSLLTSVIRVSSESTLDKNARIKGS